LKNEEVYNTDSLFNIVTVTKSKTHWWEGHLARMRDMTFV